ncbi:FABP family protein [Polynucleobacter sp. AP-Nino-20-G2]|uniref:FABP family protein n=1 Tax=Polynucleobacter sp. AP-Nino-20-G2 TaxID=2576917 RepID=UPI001BFDFE55|nr:heme-binding beta-barrel domain-containing protein [Polynucleobacter sp. AP-Nino-20-G2]QWE15906.1 FABP family protein [Polynucleobacter sp. AP-Nino-20-G2]
MNPFPDDIFTEPQGFSVDTLKNLGPLSRLAGIWEGQRGLDIKPKADGPKKQVYTERIEMQPIDPQTNGPQLFYGLRYHLHITKPDQVKTYHEQVGYWLWEPATGLIVHTLTIPRGMVTMATGKALASATQFECIAKIDDPTAGISSSPFLDYAFKTIEYRILITLLDDGTWSYEQDTVMMIKGQTEPFHHIDSNVLTKIGEPTPNPLAMEATKKPS